MSLSPSIPFVSFSLSCISFFFSFHLQLQFCPQIPLTENRLNLVIKLKCERASGDVDVGEVNAPLKELLDLAGNDKSTCSWPPTHHQCKCCSQSPEKNKFGMGCGAGLQEELLVGFSLQTWCLMLHLVGFGDIDGFDFLGVLFSSMIMGY
ncbi:hypothetical protein NC651_000480 [Populus alba x Populus x berolinensis]|nr:hypothetical protein NC651_000480 [Populus alba x Populus x berolinensis]